MPSKSAAQARFMAAVAHNPAFARKVGVPVSVGREFNKEDTMKKASGGAIPQRKAIAMGKKCGGTAKKPAYKAGGAVGQHKQLAMTGKC